MQTKGKVQRIITYDAHGLIVRSRDKQDSVEEAASLYHLAKTSKTGLEKLKVT